MEDNNSNDSRRTEILHGVTFMESESPRYHDRTVVNARWADLTVAFASDFTTAGERLTRTAAGDRYLGIRLPGSSSELRDPRYQKMAAELLSRRCEGRGQMRLNIAGNGLETLSRGGISQEDIDDFVSGVLGYAMSSGMTVSEVRSGGQSGADEAGTKAAVGYNVPASVLMPRGWLFNDAEGNPHWSRSSFTGRFEGIAAQTLPRDEFDVKDALSSPRRPDYNPSLESILPGMVAGDMIGAPYERAHAGGTGFDLFSTTSSPSRAKGTAYHHPHPTANTVLASSVAGWMSGPGRGDEASLKKAVVRQLTREWPSSSTTAAAVSVIGLRALDIAEARDLSAAAIRALGRNPERERPAEAIAIATYMASHGRTKDDISFAMDQWYGFSLDRVRAGIRIQAMQREGRSFAEIAPVIMQDYGVPLSQLKERDDDVTMDDLFPRVRLMDERKVLVNGQEYSYLVPSKTLDRSSSSSVPLAVACFLETRSFEDSVRLAVSLGGDSPSLAAMAGSLSAAYYGGVPSSIANRCDIYLTEAMRQSFERYVSVPDEKVPVAGPVVESIDVHTFYGERFAVIPGHSSQELATLVSRAGISVVTHGEMRRMFAELKENEGTNRLDGHYGGMRRLYLSEGRLTGISGLRMDGLPDPEQRKRARVIFDELSRRCEQVRCSLERMSGVPDGYGHLRFTSAYYPSLKGDRVEIREGDLLAGAFCIDQSTGLLRVEYAGDYRDGEYRDADWCRETVFDPSRIIPIPDPSTALDEGWMRPLRSEGIRMDSESMASLSRLRRAGSPYTEDLDGIMSAVCRFCLDEGVGVTDLDRVSNIERANADVAQLVAQVSHSRGLSDIPPLHGTTREEMQNALSRFSEGFRVISRGGLYNLQDRDGGFLLHSWYPAVTPMENGWARVQFDDGRWNYVGRDGCALLNDAVDRACSFREGWAAVCRDGKWNYIDAGGFCMTRDWFDKAADFVDGRAVVERSGKVFTIDTSGDPVSRSTGMRR